MSKLKENGYKTPSQAHLSKRVTKIKETDKLKITGEIMSGEEGYEKNLIVPLYPVKIKNVKNEVRACQSVNTS